MLYQIYFYVPMEHCEEVKNAMFATGAGKIGNYSACAWQIKGSGQFYPDEGSNPFLGNVNEMEYVKEYKVEMVCDEESIHAVIIALKSTHPYEEVAYGVIPLLDI
jgi:structural toxin protein (hemagglutinin/hemolysin) RtxA